jgi:hypothetical protein
MFRTFRLVIGVVLMLALFAGTTLTTSAAGPQAHRRLSAPNMPASPAAAAAPNGNRAQGRANLKADLAALDRQSAISPRSGRTPSAVRAATALHQSLSASQKRQLNAIVSKYSQRLTAISARFDATPSGATRGKAPQNVRRQADALATLNARMTREVNRILTRSQRANHAAATRPLLTKAVAASAAAATGSRQANSASVQPQTLGSYCYYGAYYEALATWYKYYGYLYAYYNYATYGGTYAYYGYYYGYYADLYGDYASSILPQVYFDWLTTGRDWRGLGDNGASYAYYDYYYAYYSHLYSYYSYLYEGGHTYAYYAYYYEYYGKYYGYYGYYYSYNYCQ